MTSDPRLAVFRADAAPAIGAGHAMRCLTFADRLVEDGWEAALVSGRNGRALPVEQSGRVDIVELAVGPADEPAALASRWPDGCDLLVVDHYERDAEFERACRPWAGTVLAIDDLANRPHDCDVLLDGAPGRDADAYSSLVPSGCLRLLGPAYLPLRPGFASARAAALARRQAGGKPRRLLISLGATDPDNMTGRVLDALEAADLDLSVDVLLGSGAPHLAALRPQLAASALDVTLHVGVDDVAALLVASDLAIGAGGLGALERCCLALPSLLVLTASNQRAAAAGLAAAGAARLLGEAAEVTGAVIAQALGELIASDETRLAMARAGAALCDGRGSARLLGVLDPPRAKDGAPVRLRPARPADGAIMLAWQGDPRTRRYFRVPNIPTPEEHSRWLAARLADPACLLNLILHDEAPAGVVRLDRRPADGDYEISIHVAPDRWRGGVAKSALALARALVPEAVLWAEVMPGNEASHALFRSAGYVALDGWYVNAPQDRLGDPRREATS